MAFTKLELSGSTDGRPILVVATSGSGTVLHTATTGTGSTSYDEIWLYAGNSQTSSVRVALQWGGTTYPDDHIIYTVPAAGGGPLCISPGWVLQNALVARATAGTASVTNIIGFVNRISGQTGP